MTQNTRNAQLVNMDVNRWVEDGDRALVAGNLAQAAQIYARIIRREPNVALHHCKLGKVLLRQDLTDQAEGCFKQALDLNADSHLGLHGMAQVAAKRARWSDAVEKYKQLIELKPGFIAGVYQELGVAQKSMRDWAGAAATYREAIAAYPQAIELYSELGDAQKELGDKEGSLATYREAVRLYQERIQRRPDYPENYQALESIQAKIREVTPQENSTQPAQSKAEKAPKKSKNAAKAAIANPNPKKNPTAETEICPELSDDEFIEFCFTRFLYRRPPSEVLPKLSNQLKHKSRIELVEQLLNGAELKAKQRQTLDLLPEYSDEEFVNLLSAILFRAKPSEQFQKNLNNVLEKGNLRSLVLANIINHSQERLKTDTERVYKKDRSPVYYIVGQSEPKYVEDWYKKFAENITDRVAAHQAVATASTEVSLRERIPGWKGPIVSIITSIYDGDDFMESFMKNITSQSIFASDCELIIIDANSPGSEAAIAQKYSHTFKNISYIKYDERISIYEAWNIGVEKAKGLFLTNANLDDIKRFDCLERQAEYLIANQDTDIVYSDYAYTLEPNLPFELSCLEGHQTNLPVADAESLLAFNSPHCSPMWRASIHDSLGLFDSSFRSAGDMELWLKASFAGHKLGKIDETLVAYYFNPKGLSTDTTGVGHEEGDSVLQKYRDIHQRRQTEETGPVQNNIELTLAAGQQVSVQVPDNHHPIPQSSIGDSSYFAFSMYKSGSTLLTKILGFALDSPKTTYPKVNLSQQFFGAGIDARNWMEDKQLNATVLPGYYHIGFREHAPFLDSSETFKEAKKLLLVRDPRDSLVSLYYSMLKSHKVTEGEFGKSQQEFRDQLQSVEIDDFVKQQSDWILSLYERYLDSESFNSRLKVYKYEEVIFSKLAWIDDMMSYLNIEISDQRKAFILDKVDIVPTQEDSNKHIRTVTPGDHRRKLKDDTIQYLDTKLARVLKHYKYSLK